MTAASLAAQGQRSGKFRHIYGEPWKPQKQITHLTANFSGESSYVQCNRKYCSVPKDGNGGSVYIFKVDEGQRVQLRSPLLNVHKKRVLETQWNPFHLNMICTASEDKTLAISKIPNEFNSSVKIPLCVLAEHSKRVQLCDFHPSADNILASASMDKSVKIWDISKQACLTSYTDIASNYAFSLKWNDNGSLLGMVHRDKKLRMIDPRNPNESLITNAFDSAKASKLFWIPNINWVGLTGFSGINRSLRFYDMRQLRHPIYDGAIDKTSAILVPFFDTDLGVLYLAGKGDGNIMFGEIINNDKKWYQLGMYKNTVAQKGGSWLPKIAMNIMNCEVARYLKLTKNKIIPISFIIPRKNTKIFQEDIYPNCCAGQSSLTGEQWFEELMNRAPVRVSMNPQHRKLTDNQQQITFDEHLLNGNNTLSSIDVDDDIKQNGMKGKSSLTPAKRIFSANSAREKTPKGASLSARMALFNKNVKASTANRYNGTGKKTMSSVPPVVVYRNTANVAQSTNSSKPETPPSDIIDDRKSEQSNDTVSNVEYGRILSENRHLKQENQRLIAQVNQLQAEICLLKEPTPSNQYSQSSSPTDNNPEYQQKTVPKEMFVNESSNGSNADYHDEEKDMDYEAYVANQDIISCDILQQRQLDSEEQRHLRISQMKEEERKDRLRREREEENVYNVINKAADGQANDAHYKEKQLKYQMMKQMEKAEIVQNANDKAYNAKIAAKVRTSSEVLRHRRISEIKEIEKHARLIREQKEREEKKQKRIEKKQMIAQAMNVKTVKKPKNKNIIIRKCLTPKKKKRRSKSNARKVNRRNSRKKMSLTPTPSKGRNKNFKNPFSNTGKMKKPMTPKPSKYSPSKTRNVSKGKRKKANTTVNRMARLTPRTSERSVGSGSGSSSGSDYDENGGRRRARKQKKKKRSSSSARKMSGRKKTKRKKTVTAVSSTPRVKPSKKMQLQNTKSLNYAKKKNVNHSVECYSEEEDDGKMNTFPDTENNSNANEFNFEDAIHALSVEKKIEIFSLGKKYSAVEINDELVDAVGKDLLKLKMVKLEQYNGKIPLVLHMLETRLSSLNKYHSKGMFDRETMMSSDLEQYQLANNIYILFSSLPTPLLAKVDSNILDTAINVDAIPGVVSQIEEPYASTLTFLWDVLAKVAVNEESSEMDETMLGRVFGPMCTILTIADVKGNRISHNALLASRMMVFFRRGIQWRMSKLGVKEE